MLSCDIVKESNPINLFGENHGMFVPDTDDDNYRPSKRSRADFRPPAMARSYDDDTDAMPSSQERARRAHSRDDVPMTDQTDDYPYEVLILLSSTSSTLSNRSSPIMLSRQIGVMVESIYKAGFSVG